MAVTKEAMKTVTKKLVFETFSPELSGYPDLYYDSP